VRGATCDLVGGLFAARAELPGCQHRASGRRKPQPSEGTASVVKMNCEVDLEQELIAAP
jgi:predicted alpha/beta-hydrolase family hydrolase